MNSGASPKKVLRLGVSVVLDFGLWARIERDEMRSAARGLGVGIELHYLEVRTQAQALSCFTLDLINSRGSQE